MSDFSRRDVLKTGAGLTAGLMGGASFVNWAETWADQNPFMPEADAKLRVLRFQRFVESEDVQFEKNLKAFSETTGIPIQLDREWLDDIQPKASVAANVGAGPDIVWGPHVTAHLFPDVLIDLTDVCNYLGEKYGGWYPIAQEYGMRGDRWICIPLCVGGNYINYRSDWTREAGFDAFPDNTNDFLKLSIALKKNGHAGGMALGHASTDANTWSHWLLWGFGARLVDEDNHVVINSPETIEALEFGRELYDTFVPDTKFWLDGDNNKAFLSGQISYTVNAISIYAQAVRENIEEIAMNMEHAYLPIGPVGKPTELHIPFPWFAFKYSKYPNACKALMAFMMEAPQYNLWLQESVGYFTQTLRSYNTHPVWTEDPKRRVFRDASERAVSLASAGSLGFAAASAFAIFIIVDLVRTVITGQASPAEAIKKAEKRANRYYRI